MICILRNYWDDFGILESLRSASYLEEWWKKAQFWSDYLTHRSLLMWLPASWKWKLYSEWSYLCAKWHVPLYPQEAGKKSLQNYDKTQSLLGRGLELLTAHSPFSLFSNCDLFSHEVGHFGLTEKQGSSQNHSGMYHLLADTNPSIFSICWWMQHNVVC